MRTSIQVGRIIGIPIRLHFTFLFILPLIVLMFAEGPKPIGLGETEELSRLFRYSLATISASLFFLSLLLHEMSHSYVAMRYGTKIKSITLFIFGGLAMMEDLPKKPEKEWRISIAGPLMSFAIGGVFLFTHFGINRVNLTIYEPIAILLFSIGLINVALASFNLLPAFPMDGGRVLRAFLAKRMRFLEATRRAVLVGKTFAVIMGVMGFMPDLFVLYSTGAVRMPFNPWLTLIAIILYLMATEEESATVMSAALERTKVRNVMRTENVSVRADMPIADLVEKILKEKNAEYAVVSDSGDLEGFITLSKIKELSAEQRHSLKVSDIINPVDRLSNVISPQEEAIKALNRMIRTKKIILAVEEEGSEEIIGVITRRDIVMHIEMLKER